MKECLKRYLFNHNILVCEKKEDAADAFACRVIMEEEYSIRITSGKDLVTKNMIPFIADNLGKKVPVPFYRGFPESVRVLTPKVRLFDQAIHYIRTYGMDNFSTPGHSIIEDFIDKPAFNEDVKMKSFSVMLETDAIRMLEEYANDLLKSTRPLNDDQYTFLCSFITEYEFEVKECASKNLVIRLLADLRNIRYADFIALSDVIKLVDEINYRRYNNRNIKQLNLKNSDRKFIKNVIDYLFINGRCDVRTCHEKKDIWAGLLHHIHYKPVNDNATLFVNSIRCNKNLSVYAQFEEAIENRDMFLAVDTLKKGKGSTAILRNLNYILSRCRTREEINYVLDSLEITNGIALIQLLMEYAKNNPTTARTFKFTKYNKLIVHKETTYEQCKRKSVLPNSTIAIARERLKNLLTNVYRNKLGKVYIDSNLDNIALPIQENTSFGGYGTLPKGSKITIEKDKKVRAFTYWEKVSDIDLSIIGIDRYGKQKEFSWRTMWNRQSNAITFSGDQTSGFYGGSEYFDIDIEAFKVAYPEITHLVFCNNVFSAATFDKCICKAGYMLRDIDDTGKVFEPKTVQSSFIINCNSRFAYLFAIDTKNNEFIWLNIARESNNHIAGSTDLSFITDYFDITSVMNLKELFKMMATEIVNDPSEADVIVTDKEIEVAENQRIIRTYDFEKIIALINS